MPPQDASPSSSSARRAMLRFAIGLVIGLAAAGLAGGAFVVNRLWQELPAVDHLADYQPRLPLRIHARDGTLLAEFGEERREFVAIDEIPMQLRQALLAIEDSAFYEHRGVDYAGLARAAWANVAAGGHAQGGSTITMQVARLFFLSAEKTYRRKIMEILLAYKLERAYDKDKLLELYMNQAYLGQRAYGFAAAASVYFDKPLQELTLAEAAMLAGLPKAPSAYNPVANRERAVVRQHHILSRLQALGWIDRAAYEQARAEPLVLRDGPGVGEFAAGHPVEQARQMVVERFGEEAYTRGLDVTLSIDVQQQRAAMGALREGLLRAQAQRGYAGPEGRLPLPLPTGPALRRALAAYGDSDTLRVAVVRAVTGAGIDAVLRDGTALMLARAELPSWAVAALRPQAGARTRIEAGSVIRVEAQGPRWRLRQLPRLEGALVTLDAGSGEILALAGGFDARRGQYDHAVQALRQPGSTFKPFVYSAALEKGFFPGTLLADAQREVTPAARGRKAWTPRNYGHQYDGVTSARRALVRSKNVATVNLMEAIGARHVQAFAARFGFDPSLNPAELPLALGAGAISPLGLAGAYAVFANGGQRVAPRLVLRVAERDGPVLYQAGEPVRERAISRRNAYVMDNLLRDVVRQGTGRGALAIGREDVAGKTGTSNDARDVWFAGYSSGLSTVVWMGYDQPRSLGRATGGTLALPVWSHYMKGAVAGRTAMTPTMPQDLASFGGDFVYPEYLGEACVEDVFPHVALPLACPG
ncbi:PBP1A family penicillin-binding protein [Ramlibacter tataouinensis]|uniref:penicillin-binding protein 1A n=1 Tax=Ramlibacter tataouinensis TaxID=94132 RepID=UPI0022F398AB|nr:PBP1A family penicillin-binding protein [Ramlibacter tataouinensis]WBY02239.1 PBP1A family penicillin-binding protein [Ramlibacter tataouinensis]